MAVGTTSPRRSPTVYPGLAAGGLPICRLLRGEWRRPPPYPGHHREERRRIDRQVRETEQRSPEAAERQARIRGATRAGKGAVKSREQATRRLVDALRRLVAEDLSVRASDDRVGVSYHEARSLIRAAEVADAVPDPNVGGQV